MGVEYVPWQRPVVQCSHLQCDRVRHGDDRSELHPHDRVVQRLLQHVYAVGPAQRERDEQVPLPPIGAKHLDREARRPIGVGQCVHDLLNRGRGPGREIDILGGPLYQAVGLDRVPAGNAQPVTGADGQHRLHQCPVVTVEHGGPLTPARAPGNAPAIRPAAGAAAATCPSHRAADPRLASAYSAPV